MPEVIQPVAVLKGRGSRGSVSDYLSIARPDHWFKNIFVLPGAALGWALTGTITYVEVINLVLGLISTCLVASANYTINEWLDAAFDRHHPTKSARPGASGRLRPGLVYLQWFVLAVVGLAIAASISRLFLFFAVTLLVMGLVYNVPPARTKDRHYLDVLSESINNPIRFVLGWSTVVGDVLPPASILLAYWMGGAYLMATKRYAEYRFIGDPERAALYRRSFRFYTEQSLLASAFFYALVSSFFLGVFLIKYRIEYLISMPFFALLFTWYLIISMKTHSAAQSPERLYREWTFMAYTVALAVLVAVLTFVDMPWLGVLLTSVRFSAV